MTGSSRDRDGFGGGFALGIMEEFVLFFAFCLVYQLLVYIHVREGRLVAVGFREAIVGVLYFAVRILGMAGRGNSSAGWGPRARGAPLPRLPER